MKKYGICAVALLLAFVMLVAQVPLAVATDSTAEIDEAMLKELLMADRFDFALPASNAENLLSAPVEMKGKLEDLNNQTRMQVLYNEGNRIDMNDTAYLTYKLENRASQTLSIGTMVYFRTVERNLCALVLVPLVYDAVTGEKLDYKTSYEYSSGKHVLSNTMPTVEIPAGKTVYIAIPFTSVNDATQYVPGIALADDERYVMGNAPTRGCLWSNNSERTELMEQKLARDGNTDCLQMQFFIGGNGSNAVGARTYLGEYDLSISEVYAISKADYYAHAYDPDKWEEEETESDERPPVGVDEDGNKYATVSFTDSGLAIAPSFDVNGNILSLVYDRDRFDYVAKTFSEDGFTRVYVVTTRGGIPAASSASNQWNDPGDTRYHIAESVILSGNPNFEFLYACHKYGLEVIAVYKPYEGGGVSKGEGADLSNTLYYEETVGGYWTGYDAFVSAHPEMRLSRKEDPKGDAIVNDTITKVEAAFIMSAFSFHVWTGGLRNTYINSINKTPLKLYVSKNNLDYVEYDGDYTVSFDSKTMSYYDENGWDLTGKKVKCMMITIEGIEIGPEYQYLALTMEDKTDRYIIPQSNIKIYNEKGEQIPATVGTSVRYKAGMTTIPDDYIWGAEDIIRGTEKDALNYFKAWGFEFDLDGNGSNNDAAYINSYLFGIARGHFQYAKGVLCEAYPEVQEYWLSEVQNLLNLGYDGIEIRLQAHASMYSDYAYYGFNEPLMEAFIEKYGYDPGEEEKVSKETAYKIACLRGELYMDFMTAASEMTHAAGKTFGFHMRSAMIDDSMDVVMNTALHQLFCWAMPKIIVDWKQAIDLCDTVTIKQNWANNYDAAKIRELTDYAVSKDVQVWITSYTQQFTNVDEYGVQIGEANVAFFNTVAKDKNVYGIQMYEWDPTGDRFQHAFNILKKKLNYIPREKK